MKLVIFDLDQTLVDLTSVRNKTTREIFRKFFGVDIILWVTSLTTLILFTPKLR